MKVTFLRHATSIFNELHTSEKDCDLSEAGKKQAADLSGEYDIVFCSIMKRAKQTLALSQIRYTKVNYTHVCREKKTDICDFLPNEDQTKTETEENVEHRIYLLKVMLNQYQGKKILVVSHGDFIYQLNGKTKYPENAEFQEIEIPSL